MIKSKPDQELPATRGMFFSVSLLFGLIAFVIALLLIGRVFLNLDEGILLEWFQHARGTVWAFPLTVATFTALAFIGVPQWVLITGSIIAFGPFAGAVFAWGATLVSASLDFWLARYLGADRLKRVGGDLINRIAGLVRKTGFFTSLTVRLVPTGPFILVNMAAGISKMHFFPFLAGTSLGIIPKIAAIALAGQSVLGTFQGHTLALILGPAALAICAILVMLYGRSRLLRRMPKK